MRYPRDMLIRPVDYFLIAWFALAAASTIYVAWDQYRNNPEPVVMKWGFILVTLYMGPLGLLLYVMADKDRAQVSTKRSSHHSGNRAWAQRSTALPATRPASFWLRSLPRRLGCRCGWTSSSSTPQD